MISERKIIAKIRSSAKYSSPDLLKGIGDDCAVLDKGDGVLSLHTVDTLVEGVHFDRAWHPAKLLGRKAANVNVSDIAAMGGHPQFALLSLAFNDSIDESWLAEFMAGFNEALAENSAVLIGGDTVKSPGPLVISVTMIGEVMETDVLYRSGAKLGDDIWVGGNLGAAAAGLALCRAGEEGVDAIKAHLDPDPQVELARYLATSGMITAMLDSSDGPATDIAHICAESGVGAEISAASLPISPTTIKAAATLKMEPRQLALKGGEDYVLIFTSAKKNHDKLKARLAEDIHCIGRIIAGTGVFLLTDGGRQEISYQGYEHSPI